MKKTIRILAILLTILFFPFISKAQINYEDVVYLKNGSIIHGLIIEQVPNHTIKIQTRDGNIFVFKMEEIEKLTKEQVGNSNVPTPEINPGKTDSISPKLKMTIGGGISLTNSFKRGNAEQFYQFLSNNPELALDDGANGFKFVSLGFQGLEGKILMGLDFQYVLTHPSRAIWGEDTDYGYATRMYFSAKFINMALKVGFPIGEKSYLIFEPGMDFGIMSGKIGIYNSMANYSQEWLQSGAFGLGGHFSAGFDFAIVKSIVFTGRAGYRSIKIDETHESPTSSTGYSSFYANGKDGDIVKVDWSGFFANTGILLVFGK